MTTKKTRPTTPARAPFRYLGFALGLPAIGLFSLYGFACSSSDDKGPGDADSGAGAARGSGGSGGKSNATGGTAGSGTGGSNPSGGSGGSSNAGGSGASGGSSGSGGIPASGGRSGTGGVVLPAGKCTASTDWSDVSSPQIGTLGGKDAQSYPGGCSGVAVNRLTGDVFVHIVGFGIWKSSDTGATWTRVDDNTIDASGGRCETGWAIEMDQDDPPRMAVFTLDGTAGYTINGKDWKQWKAAPWYRGWDYGSVDWSDPDAKTIIAVEHEKPSQIVALSTDGGSSWKELTTFDVPSSANAAMVGAIDSKTLIGSNGSGIMRSTDLGATWNKVSDVNPITHVPVRFNGKFYLGTSDALLVSGDGGATWQRQGVAVSGTLMFLGPYFGADENTMVVGTNTSTQLNGGSSSIYKTVDRGAHWTKIGDAPSANNGFALNFTWFGGMSWDPVNDAYYATAMANPAFRKCAE